MSTTNLLFEFLFPGGYNSVSAPRRGKAYVALTYPCGIVHIGESVQVAKLDNLLQKSKSDNVDLITFVGGHRNLGV